MILKLRAWFAAHPRWSVAIIIAIAVPAILYGALVWKTHLRTDRLASVNLLVRQFDQVMFQSKPEWEHGKFIVKWIEPIHIKIVGDSGAKWQPMIERHAAMLAKLMDIEFVVFSQQWVTEDFFIYFADPSEFEKIVIRHVRHPGEILEILDEYTCFAIKLPYLDGFRFKSALVISSTRSSNNRISRCIVHRLTQLIGFNFDSELIRPSVFSRWEWNVKDLFINDRIIVRTLYDKRMKRRMKRNEALKMARIIITELVAEAKAEEAVADD